MKSNCAVEAVTFDSPGLCLYVKPVGYYVLVQEKHQHTITMKSPPKVILRLLVLILLSVALTSCSKNLSRTEAQSQIEESYKTKRVYERIKTSFETRSLMDAPPYTVRSGQLSTDLPDVIRLSEAGLLNVSVTASGINENYMDMTGDHIVDRIAITMTEEGKPFFAGESEGRIVLVAATPTIKILGITEPAEGFGRKTSLVTFEVAWENTQVANILNKRYSADRAKATFVKYDTGWRLEE